jgi:hypothetical protein
MDARAPLAVLVLHAAGRPQPKVNKYPRQSRRRLEPQRGASLSTSVRIANPSAFRVSCNLDNPPITRARTSTRIQFLEIARHHEGDRIDHRRTTPPRMNVFADRQPLTLLTGLQVVCRANRNIRMGRELQLHHGPQRQWQVQYLGRHLLRVGHHQHVHRSSAESAGTLDSWRVHRVLGC